jgi:hypothetical protein
MTLETENDMANRQVVANFLQVVKHSLVVCTTVTVYEFTYERAWVAKYSVRTKSIEILKVLAANKPLG